ncbi:MAG: T9SS type A sorting domain-containing protein [Rhizobacter sp.]|nr:T9SS type A sorting domain-containing protein [Ferruginibacter sp.]
MATNSTFTNLVTGFSNLNVGNVISTSVTGLACNTTYYYRVRASNICGTTNNSGSINTTTSACCTAPSIPAVNAATSITATSFQANWNSANGATAYLLDVATNSTFTNLVTGFGNLDVGNVISKSVTVLACNTTYYFRVRASNSCGTSGNSGPIQVGTSSCCSIFIIPKITIFQTYCLDSTIIVHSSVTNGGTAPSFTWQQRINDISNWQNVPGGNNDTLKLVNQTAGIQLRCILKSNANCISPQTVISDTLTANCISGSLPNIDCLEDFLVVPNPNNGLFTVKIVLSCPRKVGFRILNALGQIVYQIEEQKLSGTNTKKIDVQKLNGGVYFFQTVIENRSFTNILFINQ